jgi:hypothetical protein
VDKPTKQQSAWLALLAPRTGFTPGYVNPADAANLEEVGFEPMRAESPGGLTAAERALVEGQAQVDAPARGSNYVSDYLASLPQMQAQQPMSMSSQQSAPGILPQNDYDALINRLNAKSLESQRFKVRGSKPSKIGLQNFRTLQHSKAG